MIAFNLTTPVVFIIFNKIEATEKVFEVLKRVRPSKLFIIADGPRKEIPEEDFICAQVRKITEEINWECEVFRNYADENLGLRKRIMTGLHWVFQNVMEAIIIEDDCLPDDSFFKFCQDMLKKYEHNEKVLTISGNKILSDIKPEKSYYFSRFAHIWGWATWKRTWENFVNQSIDLTEDKIKNILENNLNSKSAVRYWQTLIGESRSGIIDAWSLKLQLMQFMKSGLTVIPSKNLVVNLGFGTEQATNTKGSGGLYRKMKLETISFPLSHPELVEQNLEADKIEIKLFHKFGFKEKIRRLLLKFKIRIK
jgi:hypothetical protein